MAFLVCGGGVYKANMICGKNQYINNEQVTEPYCHFQYAEKTLKCFTGAFTFETYHISATDEPMPSSYYDPLKTAPERSLALSSLLTMLTSVTLLQQLRNTEVLPLTEFSQILLISWESSECLKSHLRTQTRYVGKPHGRSHVVFDANLN